MTINAKTTNVKRCLQVTIPLLLVGMIGLSALTVHGKDIRSDDQIKREDIALRTAIQQGDQLWHDPTLGSNGLACANCHGDASATNPHSFPKYQTNLGKVSTLREMINWCIAVPLQGLPLDLDSPEMIAMESYATYMHRGVPIAMGVDEQHGGFKVDSGPGYKAVTEEEKKFLTESSSTPTTVSTKAIGDLELANASGCLGCHAVDKKVVGPAWRDVAEKYKGDPKAREFLINKVAQGGGGNWTKITGGFKMPPNHPRVSMENITLLVDFVLSLSEEGS